MNLRLLIALAIIAILATAAYGFAATNTINDGGHAGDGSGTISGYTVTDVSYTLASNPAYLAAVQFDLGAEAGAGKVKVSLDNGGTWSDCTNTADTTWSCDITSLNRTVKSANNLRVVAAD